MKYYKCHKCQTEVSEQEVTSANGMNYHTCGSRVEFLREVHPDGFDSVNQVGGSHYSGLDPWALQRNMLTSGSAFVDARRADIVKYAFRKEEAMGHAKMIEDLKKARHCCDAAISQLEKLSAQPEV